MTVAMFNPERNKSANVHPDEVDAWKRKGWRLVDGQKAAKQQDDEFDIPRMGGVDPWSGYTDADLRDLIGDHTGEKPHNRTGRPKLIEQLEGLGIAP